MPDPTEVAAATTKTQDTVTAGKETPAAAKAAPAASTVVDDTILGSEEVPAGEVKKEEVKAGEEKPAEKTAEEKAAETKAAADKVVQEAADKKLLESDDKTLTPDQLAKKKELVKAQEDAKANSVPEKEYVFKLPEGQELDKGLVDLVTPIFKDAKITQAVAQKLVDAYAPYVKSQVESQQKVAIDNWKAQIKTWGDETRAEFSEGDFKKNVAPAAKFINKFGGEDSKAIRELLKDTGVGNHKLIVKMLVNAGKALVEDDFVEGKENKSGDGGVNLRALYPTMTE